MYHPPPMRKTGPILILVIGLAALIIDFVPEPPRPRRDRRGRLAARSRRKLGLDLQGGLRVEYQAQQVGDKIPRPERPRGHPRHHRAPRERDRRLGAGRSRPRAPTASSSSCPASPTRTRSASSSARPAGSTSSRSAARPMNEGDDDRPRAVPAALQRRAARDRGDRPGPDGRPRRRRSSSRTRAPSCSRTTPRAHVGEYFAIVLDSRVISAPVDQRARSPAASVQITSGGIGGFPLKEATERSSRSSSSARCRSRSRSSRTSRSARRSASSS